MSLLSKTADASTGATAGIAYTLPRGAPPSWRRLLRPHVIEVATLAADLFLIAAVSVLTGMAYHWLAFGTVGQIDTFIAVGVVVGVNFSAVMSARGNYRLQNLVHFRREVRETTLVWITISLILVAVGFALKISDDFSRGATIAFFALGFVAILTSRGLIARLVTDALANGGFAEKKIILITEQGLQASSMTYFELRRYGFRPARTYEVTPEEIGAPGTAATLRAKLNDVILAARAEQVEDIVLLMGWNHSRMIDVVLNALSVLPLPVRLIPDASVSQFLRRPAAYTGTAWTAELKRAPLSTFERAQKRTLDCVVAVLALVLLGPLMLATALLVKLESPGPILFRQRRHGFNGREFNILKFRTMNVIEDGSVIRQATRNDTRVTRLGRWLRRTSIDELPQLFNVLLGDMSLAGPRPHAAAHNSEYEKLIASYAFRYHVKPGITGWAQVSGFRGETPTVNLMERRVELDLWYINNWSVWLDVKILMRTAMISLRQTGAY